MHTPQPKAEDRDPIADQVPAPVLAESEAQPCALPVCAPQLAQRWRRLRAAYRAANVASHHVLGFTLKLVLLVYFAFTLMFLGLRYVVLPNIDHYKDEIERLASRTLGNQVSIARIYASWQGLRPNLFLGDVVLRNPEGDAVLRLPSVSATFSWLSVMALQPRFESLEIIRPDLDIRRARDGKLYVAGVLVEDKPGGGDGDWIFKQREIVVREGRIRWTDQLRGAPPLALDNVQMVLRNHWHHHRFGLRATPPGALAGPLDIRADFTHPAFADRISNVRLWKGELYADLARADLAGWTPYFDYPFQIQRGQGSLRAWLTLDHARLAAFTADVGLVNVSARLGRGLPPLELARVHGRVSARETIKPGRHDGRPTFGTLGHTVVLDDFSVETAGGLALGPTTIRESYTPARDKQPEKMEIQARELDVGLLAQLAGQLPMSAAQRAMLADFNPRGRVSGLSAEWEGSYPNIQSYRVRARLDGLGIAARPAAHGLPALPGFTNLSGSVDATDKGGSVSLDARKAVLHLPAWFADPDLRLDEARMQARWSLAKPGLLQLHLDKLQLAQGRLKVALSGKHELSLDPKAPKRVNLADFSGSLSGFQINTIGRYLPLNTPEFTRHWLTGALEEGFAQDVTLRLRGDLTRFPFRQHVPEERGRGEFRIAGRLDNARLNYAPDRFAADGRTPMWPQAERIQGSFVFDKTRMEIRAERARTLQNITLSNVSAIIPDLTAHDSALDIDGQASGTLQDLLRYVDASPVLGWIGHFTEDTHATGMARLALKFHMPLHHVQDTRVNGHVQLLGNDVHLLKDLPLLQSALGKIEFNEHGFNLNGVGASFLGGPVAVSGGTQRDGATLVRMAGTLTAEGLKRNYPDPAARSLLDKFNGSARYTGQVSFKDRQLQINVESGLSGWGMDLPAPLDKPVGATWPLRFALNGYLAPAGGISRDEIRVNLGQTMLARYERQKEPGGTWRMLRGAIGVNAPAPLPETGLGLHVDLPALNVDHWLALGHGNAAPAAQDGAAPTTNQEVGAGVPAPVGEPPHAPAPSLTQYVLPDVISGRAQDLVIGERKLDRVVAGVSHQKGNWLVNIDSRQINGHITWEDAASGVGKVTARLSSLVIPESAADKVKDLLESGKTGATIPALDVTADEFELFNRKLGRLELAASNSLVSLAREWHINRLLLDTGDGTLRGKGKYATRDGISSTSLDFVLDIHDAGSLLDRFGFEGTFRNGKGLLKGEVNWRGLPYQLDLPSLSGTLNLNVENGQFLKQDPGAAKLLGVLSLQMLPKLLKLDFHDVFSEGLAFDRISADAAIRRGVLTTENLKMQGVAATVLMDGSADIGNESANLHVVVKPEFNLGTGPLVYALAVNPAVGLSGFLAQLFLRAPVMKALTYELQISGPWKNPVIVRLGDDSAKGQAAQARVPAPVP
jgi:uncharacterized protein (TIGR02099 family)